MVGCDAVEQYQKMGAFLIEESLRTGGEDYNGIAYVVDGSGIGLGILTKFKLADLRRGSDMVKV